jgi:hypothetical protein
VCHSLQASLYSSLLLQVLLLEHLPLSGILRGGENSMVSADNNGYVVAILLHMFPWSPSLTDCLML